MTSVMKQRNTEDKEVFNNSVVFGRFTVYCLRLQTPCTNARAGFTIHNDRAGQASFPALQKG